MKCYEAEKSYCYFTGEMSFKRCPGHVQHQPQLYPCSCLLQLQSKNALAATSHLLCTTSDQQHSPWPAVTPFLAATQLTPSALGICTKVSEGLRTTAATPALHTATHSTENNLGLPHHTKL